MQIWFLFSFSILVWREELTTSDSNPILRWTTYCCIECHCDIERDPPLILKTMEDISSFLLFLTWMTKSVSFEPQVTARLILQSASRSWKVPSPELQSCPPATWWMDVLSLRILSLSFKLITSRMKWQVLYAWGGSEQSLTKIHYPVRHVSALSGSGLTGES